MAVFADYQLLAAMGHLLEYLKTAPPPEADPMAVKPFGLFPYRLPPVLLKDPDIVPQPLTTSGAPAPEYIAGPVITPKVITFGELWPSWSNSPGWTNSVTQPKATAENKPAPAAAPAPATTNPSSVVADRWPDAPLSFAAPARDPQWGPFAPEKPK